MISFLLSDNLLPIALLLFLLLNAKDIYFNLIIERALEHKEELPDIISNLPDRPTSSEDFSRVKEKIERFMYKVANNEESELQLTSNDINDIYLRGLSVDRYRINPSFHAPFQPKYRIEYFYFLIDEDSVTYRKITYPIFEGRNGLQSVTEQLTFHKNDIEVRVKKITTDINGRSFKAISNGKYDFISPISENYAREFPLSNSAFMFLLFGVVQDPRIRPVREGDVYQKALSVIEKIYDVEITNNTLVLKYSFRES